MQMYDPTLLAILGGNSPVVLDCSFRIAFGDSARYGQSVGRHRRNFACLWPHRSALGSELLTISSGLTVK